MTLDILQPDADERRPDSGPVSSREGETLPEPGDQGPTTSRLELSPIGRTGDRAFRAAAVAASLSIVALVAFVGIFLLALALPSLRADQVNFLTSREWSVGGARLAFGIAGLLWTTALSSVVAMVLAVPVAIGIAMFLTQYLPARIARPLGFVIDLLAAVPSIVYGLWGIKVLAPALRPVSDALQGALGWFPLFGAGLSSNGSVFVAAVVLAIMILPIITAISRDVFAQTPNEHKEAALALGATRWEMIRMTVLPFGRSGVVSGAMLGLGRALGETVAVMIILAAPAPGEPFNPSLFAGGETFASKIANNAQEFDSPAKTGAYIASGLVLFVVTFAVNAIARLISERTASR